VGTQMGLDRIDLNHGNVRRIDLRDALQVRALREDGRGKIWVGAAIGLARLDPMTGEAKWFKHDPRQPHSLPQGQVNALLIDSRQRLWIGGDNGLSLFDAKTGSFQNYRHDPADPDSLPDDQVMSLHEDRSGLLWVGTKFGGLAYWNPRTWSFGHQPAS